MALSVASHIGRSGVSTASEQIAVTTRNLAAAQATGTSRKIANVVVADDGSVHVASITRVSDQSLFLKAATATAGHGASRALAAVYTELADATLGDPESEASPAAVIGRLRNAIEVHAEAPDDVVRASTVVAAAADVVGALNAGSEAIRGLRQRLDRQIEASVAAVNSGLEAFEAISGRIVADTLRGADVTDALDARDRVLMEISAHIGIKVLPRGDNDMVLTTDSGIILYQASARKLSFEPSEPLLDGQAGNVVTIDGMDVSSKSSPMRILSGALAGQVDARDRVAVTCQRQLDEIARGLVVAFAERDQSGAGSLPDLPGLFTWQGAAAVPGTAAAIDGLAARLQVAASVDPGAGGNALLLRDGGISGSAAHIYNGTGAASYSGRLHELAAAFDGRMPFDPAGEAGAEASILGYAEASAAWVAEGKKASSRDDAYQAALQSRAIELHGNATGVNLDVEMANLLDLERSYQASARLLGTVGAMFDALMTAIR